MSTVNHYSQLYQSLKKGQLVSLVSRYSPELVTKTLFVDEEAKKWASQTPNVESLYLEKNLESYLTVEILRPHPRMIIFGGGHISKALVPMASLLNYHIVVYDDRPFFANPGRFPEAQKVICDAFDAIDQNIQIQGHEYVVIVTRGHKHDQDCLRFILNGQEPAYMGMIGSKRRVAIVRRQIEAEGIIKDKIDRLHSPIGLKIGAVSPAELAVSILAEVVACRHSGQEAKTLAGEATADMEVMEWLAEGDLSQAAVITVLSAKGSTPRAAGAKMVAFFDGRTIGSIGGGCAEAAVMGQAREIINTGGYALRTVDLTDSADEDGMVCGGAMEIMIEAANSALWDSPEKSHFLT
ncbi:MAG: XdhC family protein [Deltaproteobacteria bacterium]|jgi:xanthine dehydrogenase accessory factor|nr:XdhC family protein [Deltaproteobacteria bacterium]